MGKKTKKPSLEWPMPEEPEVDVALELINLFTSPTVCLGVGSMKSTYHLHRDILTTKCPYFKSRFHFYGEKHATHDEQICLIEDWDYPDAFKMFVMYIYFSRYEVPFGSDLSDICILHARVYVLAERLCMDDLKVMALQKMSSALEGNTWEGCSVDLGPETVLELLKIVYDGTRDDERWVNLGSNEDGQCGESSKPDETEHTSGSSEAPHLQLDPSAVQEGYGLPAEEMIELPPESAMLEEMPVPEPPPVAEQDRMRELMSRYAASKLKTLRQNTNFMIEVAKGGPMVADIILVI